MKKAMGILFLAFLTMGCSTTQNEKYEPDFSRSKIYKETYARNDPSDIVARGQNSGGGYIYWRPKKQNDLGSNLTRRPAPIKVVPFDYPHAALSSGIEGKVKANVYIDETGKVANVEIVQSDPNGVFDSTVRAGVMQWRFSPAVQNGKPTKSILIMYFPFILADKKPVPVSSPH